MPRKTPAGRSGTAPQSVVEAAQTGNRLTLLLAVRARLARVIDDGCSPRDLVGLSRRLLDVAQEIDGLNAAKSEPRTLRVVDGDFHADQV